MINRFALVPAHGRRFASFNCDDAPIPFLLGRDFARYFAADCDAMVISASFDADALEDRTCLEWKNPELCLAQHNRWLRAAPGMYRQGRLHRVRR